MWRYFVLLLIGFSGSLTAQNLMSFIPISCYDVTIADSKQLNQYLDVDALLNEERYVDFRERFFGGADDGWSGVMALCMYEGTQHGIAREKVVRFDYENDSIEGLGYLFLMKNQAEFDGLIQELYNEEEPEIISRSGGLKYVQNTPYSIAWNQEVVLILKTDINYGFLKTKFKNEDYYIEELSERERNELDVQMDELKDGVASKEVERIFTLPHDSSIMADADFVNAISGSYDAFNFRRDLLRLVGKKKRSYYDYDQDEDEEDNPNKEGAFAYAYWRFDSLNVNLEIHLSAQDAVIDRAESASKGKFNKKAFKYLNADNMMGYYTAAVDPENSFYLLDLLGVHIVDLLPGLGSSTKTFTNIFAPVINQKKAFKIIEGNALFSITGLKEIAVKYESFAYGKDGNRERIIKTRKEWRPEFVAVAGVRNKNIAENFLNHLEDEKELVRIGNYYRIKGESNQYNPKAGQIDNYIAYYDGLLIVTNNEEIMAEYLEDGYPKEKRLSKEVIQEMTDDMFNAYWDMTRVGESMRDYEIKIPGFGLDMLRDAYLTFESFELNGLRFEDGEAISYGSYRIDQEDNVSARFNLLEMLTSLGSQTNLYYLYQK